MSASRSPRWKLQPPEERDGDEWQVEQRKRSDAPVHVAAKAGDLRAVEAAFAAANGRASFNQSGADGARARTRAFSRDKQTDRTRVQDSIRCTWPSSTITRPW